MEEGINVVSCFDGMACLMIALKRLGIKVNKYFAYEIDKYAIQVAKANFPEIIELGDIRNASMDDFGGLPIHLVAGGSPCQGFSFSGKQLNFNDPRSALFFEFIRIKNMINPKYFLLENVVMKKEYENVITEHMGVKPILINSALVSAQNRKRLYWTNIPNIQQPEDKGIKLQDILEFGFVDNDKSYCIDVNYFKGGNINQYFNKHRRQLVFSAAIRGRNINKATIIGRRLNERGVRDDYNKSVPITQCLEVRKTNTDKSNCLTTVEKDNVLTILPPGRYEDCFNNFRKNIDYRMLTTLECERLQTVPEHFTATVSDFQAKKILGNGWTVDVIVHILKNMQL